MSKSFFLLDTSTSYLINPILRLTLSTRIVNLKSKVLLHPLHQHFFLPPGYLHFFSVCEDNSASFAPDIILHVIEVDDKRFMNAQKIAIFEKCGVFMHWL